MTKEQLILDIASELVHEHTNFMSWDKAQEMAEIILNRIESDGMLKPFDNKQLTFWDDDRGSGAV